MTPPLFERVARCGPLVLSTPHAGLFLPPELGARMTVTARDQPDADHAVHQLYDMAESLGASTLTAQVSRYVVDLNRPPDDQPLYPGQAGSGLVPIDTFTGEPLYLEGQEPDAAERSARIDAFWRPYHAALADLIARARARHGFCLLWDCHSIAAVSPRLFEGRLPDLNLGAYDGRACPSDLARAVLEAVPPTAPFSRVLDGRFKGGFITRRYGQPAEGVFALQLELSQAVYLVPDGRRLDPAKAASLRPHLTAMLKTFIAEARAHV